MKTIRCCPFSDLQSLGFPLVAGTSANLLLAGHSLKTVKTSPCKSVCSELSHAHRADLEGAHILRTHDVKAAVEAARVRRPFFRHAESDLNPNIFAESSKMVTGPSLTSSTCIISWNRPVSQRKPDSLISFCEEFVQAVVHSRVWRIAE